MPKFITIHYGDEAGYERTAPAVRKKAHEQDAALRRAGAVIGTARRAIQVRNTGGAKIETQDGAFMSSPLPVADFAVVEADSLAAAIEMLSGVPCAVAHGVVKIWPLQENPR